MVFNQDFKKKLGDVISMKASIANYKKKEPNETKPLQTKKGTKNKVANVVRKNVNEKKVKTKGTLSFQVRIYIEVSNSKYSNRKNTIIRQQAVYERQSHSAVFDGDKDGVKYVYKKKEYKPFSFKAYHFTGNTKNVRPYIHHPVFGDHQKDYDRFKSVLSKYTGYEDFISNEGNWLSLLSYLLFVVEDINYGDKVDLGQINYEHDLAYDDYHNKHFDSKHIHYNLDELSNTLKTVYTNEYVLNNYKGRECWYNAILDSYKKPFDKWYVSKQLTYEYLFKLFNGENNNADYGASFSQVVNGFFKPFKLAIYLYDCNRKLRCHYDPRDEGLSLNKHINPQVLFVMMYNGHIIKFNDEINSLRHKLDSTLLVNDLIANPSSTYNLPKKQDKRDFVIIESYEDVLNLLKDSKKDVEAIYNDDLFKLWCEIYTKMDYECKVSFTGSYINSISINNIGKIKVRISNVYCPNAGTIEIDNEPLYKNFVDTKTNFMYQLLNKNYLSRYSPQVAELFQYYTRGGIIGGLLARIEEEGEAIGLDFNKCYPSHLIKMPFVPSINSFDEFVEYDDSDIEDMTMYFYEKLDDTISYPMKKHGLIYGYNIKKFNPNVELIAMLKPSKLTENISGDLIKELYENTELDNSLKKFIMNQTIGMMAKKNNRSHYSKVFTSKKEAYNNQERYGGFVFTQNLLEFDALNDDLPQTKNVYIHYATKKAEINEGFYPIALFIYDCAEAELFDLVNKAEDIGMRIFGMNTDSIYTHDGYKLDIFKERYPEYFSEGKSKDSFDAIGKLKVEHKCFKTMKPLKVIDNFNIYKEPTPVLINNIELDDEWNLEEIQSKLVDRTIITASVAGAGKTTALKQQENVLIVCPRNTQFLDHKNNGYDAITFARLVGCRFNGKEEEKGSAFNVDKYDSIVFDEIFLHNIRDQEKINEYMEQHNDKCFTATGDPNQLDPIEGNNKDELKVRLNIEEAYYENIVYKMFPNRIHLKENKRCKKTEDQAKIKEISSIMLNGTFEQRMECIHKEFTVINDESQITTNKVIVAYNETADRINKMLHAKKNETEYYEGQMLSCKVPIVKKHYRTYKNYTYEIKKLNENFPLLSDGECEFTVSMEELRNNFKYNYCITTHSAQGLTIDEPITICDGMSYMADGKWLNTAITRCTDIKNVIFCFSKTYCPKAEFSIKMNEIIISRLNGHRNEDLAKGRKFNLNSYWVWEELKRCKYTCNKCHKHLDAVGNDAWSINRIDNHLGHLTMNCEIICRICNVSLK
jgi:hypothetical protein